MDEYIWSRVFRDTYSNVIEFPEIILYRLLTWRRIPPNEKYGRGTHPASLRISPDGIEFAFCSDHLHIFLNKTRPDKDKEPSLFPVYEKYIPLSLKQQLVKSAFRLAFEFGMVIAALNYARILRYQLNVEDVSMIQNCLIYSADDILTKIPNAFEFNPGKNADFYNIPWNVICQWYRNLFAANRILDAASIDAFIQRHAAEKSVLDAVVMDTIRFSMSRTAEYCVRAKNAYNLLKSTGRAERCAAEFYAAVIPYVSENIVVEIMQNTK